MTPENEVMISRITLPTRDLEIVDRAAANASIVNQEFQNLIADGKFRGNAFIFEPLLSGVVRRVLGGSGYFLIGGSSGFANSESLHFIKEADIGAPLVESVTPVFLKWLWGYEKGNIRYLANLSKEEIQRVLGR